MLQTLLLLISIIFSCEAFAQSKVPQSMEQINATLKAKKAELDPFGGKDVKVDLESLGLDDVDKKSGAVPLPPEPPKQELPPVLPDAPEVKSDVKSTKKQPQVKFVQPAPKDPEPVAEPVVVPESKEADKPAEASFTDKISNFLQKGADKVKALPQEIKGAEAPVVAPELKPEDVAVGAKKKTEKYVNSKKKRDLKKRLEAEKRQKLYEKKHREKAKKLRELRAKYLLKFEDSAQNSEAENDENLTEDEEAKIVPQKKNLNRFISDEPPAPPIINRFRTADNLHIPSPLTDQERIAILFDAVASGSVAFFNSAYKDIENPNVKNQIGDTILTYAVLLQKYPVMASVLARGADPNFPNNLGYSPLDIAIELLDIKALEILVSNKADIEYVDSFGRTSLMHAARVGFLPAAELLVSKGVDVNVMDNDGFTALSIAYRHKKEIIVKFLLKNGAKPWIEKPYNPEKQSLIQELENRWK